MPIHHKIHINFCIAWFLNKNRKMVNIFPGIINTNDVYFYGIIILLCPFFYTQSMKIPNAADNSCNYKLYFLILLYNWLRSIPKISAAFFLLSPVSFKTRRMVIISACSLASFNDQFIPSFGTSNWLPLK